MELRVLTDRLVDAGLLVRTTGIADEMQYAHLAQDSREVVSETVFVAVRGTTSDGHLFIDKAVNNGAIAVVCEAVPGDVADRHPGTAFLEVRDSRAALAEAAAVSHSDPSSALQMVGVTGTNGKTTTAFLTHHLLNTLGTRAGLIGTVKVDLGGTVSPAAMTTPDPVALQQALRTMVDNGCRACAMEVSSHALDQQRVRGVDYDAAIFTNLTPEHLDYHGTIEAYRDAKKKLFDGLRRDAAAIYNMDDPSGAAVIRDAEAARISYGRNPAADVRLDVLKNGINGLRLRIDGQEAQFHLVGLFNAYNLTAAYAACTALGYDPRQVLAALEQAQPVPGRFEQMRVSKGRTVVVDYAHTPDALQNVLETAVALRPTGVRIWCVFGCGGDRDRSKRPVMGRIAEQLADQVVVTSDNPRTESPADILEEIRTGIREPDRAHWILDRREAIRWTAEASAAGDIVVIAGKGHEDYQILGTEKIHFDDREEARNFLRNENKVAQ